MWQAQRLVSMLLLRVLSGCAYHGTLLRIHNVEPVSMGTHREVCVIENLQAPATFLTSYQTALSESGYTVRVIPSDSQFDVCEVVTRYAVSSTTLSRDDFASIWVYRKGVVVGRLQALPQPDLVTMFSCLDYGCLVYRWVPYLYKK